MMVANVRSAVSAIAGAFEAISSGLAGDEPVQTIATASVATPARLTQEAFIRNQPQACSGVTVRSNFALPASTAIETVLIVAHVPLGSGMTKSCWLFASTNHAEFSADMIVADSPRAITRIVFATK